MDFSTETYHGFCQQVCNQTLVLIKESSFISDWICVYVYVCAKNVVFLDPISYLQTSISFFMQIYLDTILTWGDVIVVLVFVFLGNRFIQPNPIT